MKARREMRRAHRWSINIKSIGLPHNECFGNSPGLSTQASPVRRESDLVALVRDQWKETRDELERWAALVREVNA